MAHEVGNKVSIPAALLVEWLAVEVAQIALFQLGKWALHTVRDNKGSSGSSRAINDAGLAREDFRVIGRTSVISDTPGRLRLRVAGLRGDQTMAARIARSLDPMPGVVSVTANSLTGTVLVVHDAERCESRVLSNKIDRLVTDGQPKPRKSAPLHLAPVGY
jgi:hypothetical protein